MNRLRFIQLTSVLVLLLFIAGCSNNHDADDSQYKLSLLSTGEGDIGQLQLDIEDQAYYDNEEYDVAPTITFDICGESFEAEFQRKVNMFPYINELHRYNVIDSEGISKKEVLAWAWLDPKSQEIVMYSSWYEIGRARECILTEEELTEIANGYASQYIDLDKYELIIKRISEDSESNYMFYYKRYVCDVSVTGGIGVTLTCDGHLTAYSNFLNAEWDHAIDVMGMGYYEDTVTSLTSEEVLFEIEKLFDRSDISSWEIAGRAVVLLDETTIGVSYQVKYEWYVEGQGFYGNSIRILVTENE